MVPRRAGCFGFRMTELPAPATAIVSNPMAPGAYSAPTEINCHTLPGGRTDYSQRRLGAAVATRKTTTETEEREAMRSGRVEKATDDQYKGRT
jgi:hypothetical protein